MTTEQLIEEHFERPAEAGAFSLYGPVKVSAVIAHISGPSGSGKTTLLNALATQHPNLTAKDLDEFDDEAVEALGYSGRPKSGYSDDMLSSLASKRQEMMDGWLAARQDSPVVLGGHHWEGERKLNIPGQVSRLMLDTSPLRSVWRAYRRSQKETNGTRRSLRELPTDYAEAKRDRSRLIEEGYQEESSERIAKLIEAQLLAGGGSLYGPTKKALLDSVELQPHQQRVVKKVRKQLDDTGKSRLLLVHGLGSGKTLSSIAGSEQAGVPYTAAVPASLRENYRKDIEKFSPDSPAAVISHEALAKGQVPNPEALVVDEVQRLRNPESQRGGALLDRAQNLKSLLLLSGTPIVNDPTDLATYVSALTDKQITPQEFGNRYVRRTVYRPGLLRRILGARTLQPGVQNEDELVDLLKGKVDFHESAKSPAQVDRQDVFVNMSPTQSEIYRGMYKKLPALTRWKLESQYDLSPNELQRMRSFMTGPRQVGLSEYGVVGAGRLSPIKAFDRSPKLQEAFKRLQSTLRTNPGAKSLIFSNFIGSGLTPYLAGLQRANIPAAVFSGAMNDQQRKQVVEDYNAGKIKALLLGPSGTEGLSTKGTRLVQRLDPHWNEARSRQSDGRALRYDSHLHLSPEDRQVMIERYFSRPMSRGVLGLYGQRPMQGADDYLTALADKKEKLNSQFMRTLQRAAEAE